MRCKKHERKSCGICFPQPDMDDNDDDLPSALDVATDIVIDLITDGDF